MYPFSGSCALVWSVTMSASKPRFRRAGSRVGRVRAQPDRHGAPLVAGRAAARDGRVEIVRQLVEVAGLQAPRDPLGIDLHAQRDAAVHRDRQRLRAAHPAEPRRQRDRPR
jgi:hypothetical protein